MAKKTSRSKSTNKTTEPSAATGTAEATTETSETSSTTPRIVAIGASAGGLEPVEKFFDAMPIESGLAFVVVQHLSPNFDSMMDELLARHSSMRIEIVQHGMKIEPNAIYLNSPRTEIHLDGNKFEVRSTGDFGGLHLPINAFFKSLAHFRGHEAIGVILSGTGSDGTLGCEAIKNTNGAVFVQEPSSAKFDGMPSSVIARDLADAIDKPEALPTLILQHFRGETLPSLPAELDPKADPYSNLLSMLRNKFRTDFSYYKPSTIERRIQRRVEVHNLADIQSYSDMVVTNPEELRELYTDILIDVTSFFREPESFDVLEREVIAELASRMSAEKQIRVWIAACATGQEAYSVAIAFSEYAREHDITLNLKILATDVHDVSLNVAGAGIYPKSNMKGIQQELIDRYFDEDADTYHVRPSIRRLIVFSQQDLIKDPPFTRLDLVSCRNVLIYFKDVAQQKVLSLFHFGLQKDGFMFLGPSESIGKLSSEFETVHQKWRIFRKVRDIRLIDSVSMLPPSGGSRDQRTPSAPVPSSSSGFDSFGFRPEGRRAFNEAMQSLLAKYAPPGFLLTRTGELEHIFGDAGSYISIGEGGFSRRITDLVHRDLKVTISTGLERVKSPAGAPFHRRVSVDNEAGGHRSFLVSIDHLSESSPRAGHLLLTIDEEKQTEATPHQTDTIVTEFTSEVSDVLHRRIAELESDLRSSEESLQTTIEELETSNEELQATNEELMASNEELQSTNEELHSVNEELYTVSAEHQRKIDELTEVTSDLDQLLKGTEIGTIFLNSDLGIRRYTPAAEKTFNLIPEDLGRPISHITQKFEYSELSEIIDLVRHDGVTREQEVFVKDNIYLIRILRYTSRVKKELGIVITIFDITELKKAQKELNDLAALYTGIVSDISESIVRWDAATGEVIYCNDVFKDFEDTKLSEIVGAQILNFMPESDHAQFSANIVRLSPGELYHLTIERADSDGEIHVLKGAVRAIGNKKGNVSEFQLTVHDATADVEYLRALEALIDATGKVDHGYDIRISQFVQTGIDYFKLDQGMFTNITGDKMQIEAFIGHNEKNFATHKDRDLNRSLCAIVANQTKPIAVHDVLQSEYKNHSASIENGFKAYIGAPVMAFGEFYGSICFFSDRQSYKTPFTQQQISFVRLLGQWLGYKVERRKQLSALRKNEEELDLIFNNVPARIWHKDSENRIIRLNKTAADSMGLTVQQATGADTYDLLPKMMAKKHHDDDLAVINSGEPLYDVVEEYAPSKGKRGWVKTDKIPHRDSEDGSANLLVISSDVTELKENEIRLNQLNTDLERQRENYLKLYRNTPVMMHSIDNKGILLEVSDTWLTKLGYTRSEVIGKDSIDFLSPESQKIAREVILPKFWKDLYCNDVPYDFVRKDGSVIQVELSGLIDDSEDGAPKTLGVLIDVSDRNLALQALKAKNDQLEQANIGLSRFAYVASHDLQEPLRKIRQFGDLLADEHEQDIGEDGKYFLDVIRGSSLRLSRLIKDLLEYSKTSNSELEKVELDLNTLVLEIVDTLDLQITEAKAAVTVVDLPVVLGDPTQVGQLFTNLISNAVKYRHSDKRLTVRISSRTKGGKFIIGVADNGIGIREENINEIFNPFTRAFSSGKQDGSGIGLAICQTVCDRHGWEIHATSTYGDGTTFEIHIDAN